MRPPSSARRSLTEIAAVGLACAAMACGGGGDGGGGEGTPATTATPASAQEVTIRVGQTFQRVSGFGASSAWRSTPPSTAQADQLFSASKGIGLAWLRIRIAPDGTTVEMPTVRLATARGANVWAAPWSPPGAWKTNGSDTNGGSLRPEFYGPWADRLADFAASMKVQGFPLVYLSAQNEPGWVADWETCEWTPTQLLTFVRDYLGPALASRGLDVPLLVPESNDWNRLRELADPLLADARAAAFIGVIAMHAYGGTPFAYGRPAALDKELWESEWSTPSTDTGMTSGLELAQSIHDHFVMGGVNAYHYWWLIQDQAGAAGGLIQAGVTTKRVWVMGNYSKFARPGSLRVDATVPASAYNLTVTAFRRASPGTLVVVIANRGTATQPLHVNLAGGSVGAVTPWVTSDSLDLASQASIGGGTGFDYDLPARSVTTFVGPLM